MTMNASGLLVLAAIIVAIVGLFIAPPRQGLALTIAVVLLGIALLLG
jgi:hypothetical protein